MFVGLVTPFLRNAADLSTVYCLYFFPRYIFTQIPGGWLAGRYGGRRVLGICQAVCALSTLAVPLAARANVYIIYFLRFILGLAAVMCTCFEYVN